MKLTDTQLVTLSAASQREDRAIELAPNLKGGAAHKVVGMQKIQTQGVHHITLVGADRRTSDGSCVMSTQPFPGQGAALPRAWTNTPRVDCHFGLPRCTLSCSSFSFSSRFSP
jgi:hypothetical protein